MKDLISIIIPVYNTEKYLGACIDSLLAQTYANLEIILVDDGSKDSSPQICDKYAEKDARIKVIHKENAGVSEARNSGLAAATGEFIGFVDSDDIIAPSMYELLFSSLAESSSDISVCKLSRFFDGEEKEKLDNADKSVSEILTMNSTEALSDMLRGRHFYGSLCDKLFKAELLRGAKLRKDIFNAEDFLFTLEAILKAEKVCFSNVTLYFYRMRETSATHTLYSEKQITSYDALLAANELMKKYGVYDTLRAEADASAVICHVKIMRGLYENPSLRKKYVKRSVKELRAHLNKKSMSILSPSLKNHALLISLGAPFYFAIQKILNPKK